MSVFVDSSAILALFDLTDRFHSAADQGWQELRGDQERLVSTNYVAVESFTLLQRRFGLQVAAKFQELMMPRFDIKWIGPAAHAEGAAAVLSAGRRQLSLVDCTSFATMRELGLRRFFGFDAHFTEQGFAPVVAFD